MSQLELVPRPSLLEGPVRWLLFRQGRLMMRVDGGGADWLEEKIHHLSTPEPLEELYVGRVGDIHCIAIDLPDDAQLPEWLGSFDLRQLLGVLDLDGFAVVSRATQLATWYRNHRFCSRCGAPTQRHSSEFALSCPACGYSQYPRITPCVIMLVRRGNQALLARSNRFKVPMFSCLAGFMEAGESAEQAVMREVMEESGLEVHNLRYHGSQSWPFPHSLMLAFHAEYESGEICPDGVEIIEAGWFSRDQLPLMPPQGSISRSLIDSWLQGGSA